MLTQKVIERLSKMGSKDRLITSLYLNVDKAGRNHDYKIAFKGMLKEKKQRLEIVKGERKLTRDQVHSVESDFARLEKFILDEFVHKDVSKGLAIFASTTLDYWEIMELPQPVDDYLNIDYDPYIRPLSHLVCDHRSYAVILIDSAKAKIFDVTLGFAREYLSWTDDVQSKVRYGGMEGIDERKIDRAHEEMVHKHFKKIASETDKLLEQRDMLWLVVGGRQNIITQFEATLPAAVRKKIVGHIVVEPDAPLNDVLAKSEGVARKAEQRYEQEIIDKLRNESHGNGGKGLFGLKPTLQALRRGGVQTLVVMKGYTAPGFVCHKCFFIGTPDEKGSGDACPICSGPAHNLEDVVEEAITYAYMQGCRVEMTAENSRMKIMNQIGALLRY